MIKFYKMIFGLTMMAGTLITISSYSWLSLWVGLEINLLSIIPLLKTLKNQYPAEAAFKYFIIQSMASTMFLFSLVINMNYIEQSNNIVNNPLLTMFYVSILIKLGAAPFHAWFPEVLEGLSWLNCLLMLTWQKIAPMVILIQNFNMTKFLILVIMCSSMVGGVIGLNQMSLRKIMAYSSINHISWMIASMSSSKMIWMIYFLIYSLITLAIVLSLKSTQTMFLHQMSMFKSSKLTNLALNLNFLSLGGLPPFLGFFPKWLTINFLMSEKNYLLSLVLIMLTLVSLFIYTRILFSTLIIYTTEKLLIKKQKNSFMLSSLNFMILFSLMLCPAILNSI